LASGTELQQSIAGRLPAPDELGEAMTGPVGASILGLVFGVTQSAVAVIAGLLIIIVLSLYWSADRNHFERLWLSLLPAGQRIYARSIWQTTETSMGNYLRSEIVQAFLAVVMLALGYRIIGLDYPLLTALLAGLAWLIPIAGFIIAALMAFLSAMASAEGPLLVAGALGLTIAVLAFLEFVVEPRLFRRDQFSGVLLILVIIIMVEAYGLIGFVIGPPLAVAIQVMGGHIIRATRRPAPTAIQVDTLEQRLAAVSAIYDGVAADNGEPVVMPPEVASLLRRLEDLIGETRRASIEEQSA
jgi:predicted PurR-regulated permease PerM